MRIDPVVPNGCEALAPLLERFGPASAALVAQRKLQRRTDSKFVLPQSDLVDVMSALPDHYDILLANGRPMAKYETLYFDTENLRCFHDHRRGFRPRHKVRIRHYKDRGVTFLEVKTKRGEFLTNKHRMPHEHNTELNDDDLAFISASCDVPANALREQLWTNFYRITLVGRDTAERITIDTGLELVSGDQVEKLEGIVIMEVKQSPFSVRTPAMLALRKAGHRPVSASKYCTASMLLRDNLRCNRLLPGMRLIQGLRT